MEPAKRNRRRLEEVFDRHLEDLRQKADQAGVPLVNLLLSTVEPQLRLLGIDPDDLALASASAVIDFYRKAYFARHADASFSRVVEGREDREAGGRMTGEAKARQGEETKRIVLKVAAELESEGKCGRGLAGRVARRLAADGRVSVGERQIQGILAKAKKSEAS